VALSGATPGRARRPENVLQRQRFLMPSETLLSEGPAASVFLSATACQGNDEQPQD